MSTYRYAAYGSNLHPIRLKKRVPSATLLGTTQLDGYRLRFDKIGWKDGSGKCHIVAGRGRVCLAVFEVSEAERARLDAEEGVGLGYNSAEIVIPEFGACSTYIAAQSAVDELVKPMDWYKEMVRLGCIAHGFPDFYVRAVEAVSVIEDSNASRAREQWKIVEELRDAQ